MGIIEGISLREFISAILAALALFFSFPDYIFEVRPKIENVIGTNYLCFIEGIVSGIIIAILVLKLYSLWK